MKHLFSAITASLLLSMCSLDGNTQSKAPEEKIEKMSEAELQKFDVAYFASGCFWCVEAVYESVEGVKEAVSGYAGGNEQNPTYEQVGRGETGHAEAVMVYYDAQVVSYETLVKVYYGSHDPTTVNGQAPDFGRQYRSIIFYQNEKEKAVAEKFKNQLEASGMYDQPIATEIVPFTKFWNAEDYHQDYEKLHPENSYVRNVSIPRLRRFQEKFPELLKKGH
ncbi:MAG: peptide-methionine (S)-S-oxide reductase MsrA [Vicingaceae bacterium]